MDICNRVVCRRVGRVASCRGALSPTSYVLNSMATEKDKQTETVTLDELHDAGRDDGYEFRDTEDEHE